MAKAKVDELRGAMRKLQTFPIVKVNLYLNSIKDTNSPLVEYLDSNGYGIPLGSTDIAKAMSQPNSLLKEAVLTAIASYEYEVKLEDTQNKMNIQAAEIAGIIRKIEEIIAKQKDPETPSLEEMYFPDQLPEEIPKEDRDLINEHDSLSDEIVSLGTKIIYIEKQHKKLEETVSKEKAHDAEVLDELKLTQAKAVAIYLENEYGITMEPEELCDPEISLSDLETKIEEAFLSAEEDQLKLHNAKKITKMLEEDYGITMDPQELCDPELSESEIKDMIKEKFMTAELDEVKLAQAEKASLFLEEEFGVIMSTDELYDPKMSVDALNAKIESAFKGNVEALDEFRQTGFIERLAGPDALNESLREFEQAGVIESLTDPDIHAAAFAEFQATGTIEKLAVGGTKKLIEDQTENLSPLIEELDEVTQQKDSLHEQLNIAQNRLGEIQDRLEQNSIRARLEEPRSGAEQATAQASSTATPKFQPK